MPYLSQTGNNNFLLIYLKRTYLLHGAVLLEKLTGLQLVKKFPAFHGTRRFITALTSVRHLSLSWANSIQSTYPQPTSWRSILILSTHLRLGLPSGLFPSGFPTKTLYPLSLQTNFCFHHTLFVSPTSQTFNSFINIYVKSNELCYHFCINSIVCGFL